MTNKQPLGRLEPVSLRDYWEREDAEFTSWLGQPENLKLLGDAIRKELEPHGQEVGVGQFRADILCKDSDSGALVLIENRIEATDHSHLGEIMTYVAGHYAGRPEALFPSTRSRAAQWRAAQRGGVRAGAFNVIA